MQGRLLDASINGCQYLDVIGTGAIWKGLISQTFKVVAQAILNQLYLNPRRAV